MFKENLVRRANNAITIRAEWDKKMDYSFNQYLALGLIVEVRLTLFCMLTNTKPTYTRVFV